MFYNDIPINYQTECRVEYKNYSYEDIDKKYGITLPKDDNSSINSKKYEYITTGESITSMENSIITYKKMNELFNKNTKEVIYLNKPIIFKVEIDEYGIYYINEKYNLYVYGEKQSETENNLVEAFKDQMLAVCYEKEENLDENALLLKKELNNIYKYAEKKN